MVRKLRKMGEKTKSYVKANVNIFCLRDLGTMILSTMPRSIFELPSPHIQFELGSKIWQRLDLIEL